MKVIQEKKPESMEKNKLLAKACFINSRFKSRPSTTCVTRECRGSRVVLN